ncbi:MAG: type II secretion system protein [Patescibacteria group bacterium]
MQSKKLKRGFTLLELLVVIAIIAILSVVVVFFIDPVEILKKSRDVQRISDLTTLKTATAIYLQDNASNSLGATVACGTTGTVYTDAASTVIRASVSSTWNYVDEFSATTTNAGLAANFIPVNYQGVSSGAPISNLPLDPVNNTTYYYRYGCWANNAFEFDTNFESTAYTVTDDRRSKDGGNNATRYEVGTDLRVMGL